MPTVTGRATDFITFSRPGATGGGATVTDRDGKIKWAGHNLLTNSESFDAAAWGKTNVTVNANAGVAPNGTTTAEQLLETTTNAGHLQGQSVATAAGRHTFAIYAKPSGRDFVGLYNGDFGVGKIFDIANGTVGSDIVAAPVSASVTAVGNGWYRCEIVVDTTATTSNWRVYVCNSSSTFSYAGDITKGIFLWGAHLYRSDLGGMVLNPARGDAYYPTTPRNLLGFTEDFSNAAWTKEASTASANAGLSPNGLTTASRLVETATSAVHAVSQIATVAASPYTFSAYLKKGIGATAPDWVQLTFGGVAFDWVNFNLTGAGSVGNSSSVGIGTITAVGDGWYRCSVRTTPTAGSMSVQIAFTNNTNAASRRPSYAGATTSDVLVWGAQLSDSASLDAYSPVYGAAVTSAAYYAPRLDYDANGSALGLLVEELRQNLLLHSAAFDNAAWTKTRLNTTGTPAWVNVTTAPSGNATAFKLIANTDNNTHQIRQDTSNINQTLTLSIFAKAAEYNVLWLTLDGGSNDKWFNLSNGTTGGSGGGTATIQPVGNGWYRCVYTSAVGAGNANFIRISNSTSGYSFAGDDASGLFVWGAQLEAGSFATSYIPNGSAVAGATRTADVASVSTQAFPYSATEGTLVVNWRQGAVNTSSAMFVSEFVGSIRSPQQTFGIRYYGQNGGNVSLAASALANTTYKSATAYTLNQPEVACLNGGAIQTNSVNYTTPPTALVMGYSASSSNFWLNGHIRQITYIPRRLSNSELQARTV